MSSKKFIGQVKKEDALKGRDKKMPVPEKHYIKKTAMQPPWPKDTKSIILGMGCYWCSENLYMEKDGIYSTQAGFCQGYTKNPTYEEVCTGKTGHNEVVRVVYYPDKFSLRQVLKIFWETHNPTTLNQQGNDRGTQYRSGIC